MELIPMWDTDNKKTLYWEFYAIQHPTNCVEELGNLLANHTTKRHAEQLIKTINDLCFHEIGPKLYINNPNICHEAVSGEGIYGLRKGNIRLYWFYGLDRRVVICPLIFVKRVQKTPTDVVTKLLHFKQSYFDAALKKNITYKK
ncbi:hypothetical protein [Oligella ureolytica]|jgi:hypothetical protein|uniref:hypothetical protein n=1 Tax=Oligella ureolytica TaxID=90244 RepID=UPI0011C02390|nr:hypothetical protein [Oligella ureolytica]